MVMIMMMLLLVLFLGCLTSRQHTKLVSETNLLKENCSSCHIETQVYRLNSYSYSVTINVHRPLLNIDVHIFMLIFSLSLSLSLSLSSLPLPPLSLSLSFSLSLPLHLFSRLLRLSFKTTRRLVWLSAPMRVLLSTYPAAPAGRVANFPFSPMHPQWGFLTSKNFCNQTLMVWAK